MKYELNNEEKRIYAGGDTMIAAIEDALIFEIEKISENEYEIMESCDRFYSVTLTKQQLLDLANELIKLTEKRVA